jgi:hypothetical protein
MPARSSPPTQLGEWRSLDPAGRARWLREANARWFHEARAGVGRPPPADTFVIDGNDFDDLSGFLCAIGEAVNGPGGYFGSDELSFDDCLFGGFGLEAPCTIRWLASARSRARLDAAALEARCAATLAAIDAEPAPDDFRGEIRGEVASTAARAHRDETTLFDELVEHIRSVQRRHLGRPDWAIDLRLE